MMIKVQSNGKTVIFELNDNQSANNLYVQLPLNTTVENFSNNEKIFYLPKTLYTTDTSLVNAQVGTVAYYAPWGNVVMFYDSFGSASGLYELGSVISGEEYIKDLSETIKIEKKD